MNQYQLNSIYLRPQECGGEYTFSSKIYVTKGFKSAFGEEFNQLVTISLEMIQKRCVESPEGADYLQVFTFEERRYWCIDDVTHITFLLPEEY